MKSKIKTTIHKLQLLNDDKDIEGNIVLWSLIKFFTGQQKVKQAAAALTYHTLFAIVPVMALMVAVAKIMGYGEAFREKVGLFLAGQENVANALLNFADSYLSNRDMNYWVGAVVGLTLLLYSVFSIFQTVDASVNSLWNLKAHSLQKQVKVFLFVLLVPFATVLLLAIWLSISSFFEGGLLYDVNIFVLTTGIYIAVLFVAYKFIPNTRVNIRHAITSATFCGVVFAIMQYSGSLILGLFGNYHNIYGDLASVLLFILWIYFSWTICLAGSRWNYLLHEGDRLDSENKFKGMSYNYRRFLTVLAIRCCKRAMEKNEDNCFSANEIATEMSERYGMPVYIATELIDIMGRKGIIAENGNERFSLCEEFKQKDDKEIALMLANAGNNTAYMLMPRLNDEEKELWKVIEE